MSNAKHWPMLPATQWAVCTLTDITAITQCDTFTSGAEDACVAAAKQVQQVDVGAR